MDFGISWDEEIPDSHPKVFRRWVGGLNLIQKWRLPRCYVNCEWKKLQNVEVYGFGDASERGYGACVYLRVPNVSGTYDTSLVISRARVAPLKKQTLPRLELLVALSCAKLVVFVIHALRWPINTNYKCWTDSTVVLSWIHTEPCYLFYFERWSSFSKALNIVGYVYRFCQNLRRKICDRVLRSDLTHEELMNAKVVMWWCIQSNTTFWRKKGRVPKTSPVASLNPFLAENDILRIKGRLQLSELSYEVKHPVIIPKCHLSFLLVRHRHKLLNHPGVDTLVSTLRSGYWIVGLRCQAKRVKRECLACKRLDSKHCSQPVAPLPEMRVTKSPVLTSTGLDYCGPLYCVDLPTKKHYILLFTCAVVRAIHLELTDSLASSD